MNLENLKSEWSAMNDRMDKQEIFKEKMFCQILNTKSDRSLNRLVAYEVVSLIISILFIPVSFYFLIKIPNNGTEYARIALIGAITFLVICVIWYGIKVFVLSKIDFAKPLKNNSSCINKYAIYIKYEKLIGYYFLLPLVVVSCTLFYVKMHASLLLWVFMSCAFFATILFVIYFYRLYNKNISTIQQNLEELRELEEK
jgi:Na+/melibiose symporter-like transporter